MNEACHYRVSVKGIVVDEQGRFLLSREESDLWDTLGGGLEHNEDPIEGLQRELFEESGLRPTWISPTPKYFVTSPRHSKPGYYVANLVYEIKFDNLQFTPSDECQELRFFTVEEARKLNAYPATKLLIDIFDPKLHGVS